MKENGSMMNLFPVDRTVAMRGIAIFLIILSHIIGLFQIRYATPLGGTGVAIFLILSGYGLRESFSKGAFRFLEE